MTDHDQQATSVRASCIGRWDWLFGVTDETDMDMAFDELFDFVDESRSTGDLVACADLLKWISGRDVRSRIHVDVLLTVLRLTASLKRELPAWCDAFLDIRSEMTQRKLDVDGLLHGLSDD